MAQRLRLYFGSGRSNTAPEILEGDLEEQQGDSDVATGLCMQPPLLSRPSQEPATQRVPPRAFGLRSEPSLKRSSSMFIPQLTTYAEPRPTKSSSMHISLQRTNGSSNGDSSGHADDVPPPCYSPPGPAPAYIEPEMQADIPRRSPPPYYNPDSLNSQNFLTDPNLPKRRVFSIGSNGHIVYSRGQPGISVHGICLQRNSPDGSDIRHFRILPYGGTGCSVQQHSLDQWSGVNGGTQRLVFQFQQNQNQDQSQDRQQAAASQEERTDIGFTSSRGRRMTRYPRIRLERSSPHHRLLLENQHQKTGINSEPKEETQTDVETQRMEARNRPNGCTFKISGDSPRRQPHFKIYFTPGGGGDEDVTLGSDSARTNPEVKII
uniref:uncharacterized protein LOC109960670 n=1 Tax=Monopterus albus TaxID=43700 RepID=UPI0009B3F86F|nr:uncharacterized protein LOC109960670 [Monopterus albus]